MTPAEAKRALAHKLATFRLDPSAYVAWAYPWGVPGGPLERDNGPDDWQEGLLEDVGEALKRGPGVYRFGVVSGHGIGKSTMVAWLCDWAVKTWPNVRGRVTANTDSQLRTTLWAEVNKWFQMAPDFVKGIWKWTATSIHLNEPGHEKNWRIDAIPWSEKNPAAFAGLHNYGSLVIIIMDEASNIPQVIWETVAGATTDKDTFILWFAFGNPITNVGEFKEVFEGRHRKRWLTRRIDSRNVRRTNKEELAEWEAVYGEDSDYFRVRVRGLFPRASAMQFIPENLVEAAQTREVGYVSHEAMVWGLDVARHGDDQSVLAKRRGRDARTFPWKAWDIPDLMQLAAAVAAEWAQTPPELKPVAIFIDVTGIGWGVYDRLVELNIPGVVPVQFGEKGGMSLMNGIQADTAYVVDRMWTDMREWLRGPACLPQGDKGPGTDVIGQRVRADLIGRLYDHDPHGRIRLERKQDMKKRDGATSPDYADALALTFFMHVEPPMASLLPGSQDRGSGVSHVQVVSDYDVHRDL